MSPYVFFALFVQTCLLQSVFSQTCGYPQPQIPYGSPVSGLANFNSASCTAQPQPSAVTSAPIYGASALGAGASYGGTGTGRVGVSGDIGASGQTVVVGAVPVLGSVDFSGTVPATGSVSISGQCGCGCNA